MVWAVVGVIGRGSQAVLAKRWVAPICVAKASFGAHLTSCDHSALFDCSALSHHVWRFDSVFPYLLLLKVKRTVA